MSHCSKWANIFEIDPSWPPCGVGAGFGDQPDGILKVELRDIEFNDSLIGGGGVP